ncbi:MAG: hypothetical protein WBC04_15590 [Candidatus Acidiferrales bacterium]
MRRRINQFIFPFFAVFYSLGLLAALVLATLLRGATPDRQQSGQPQSSQSQSANTQQGSTDQGAAAAAPQATAPDKPKKAKKVYTDDDFASSREGAGKAGSLPPDINACDTTCENRIRSSIEPEDITAFENELANAVASLKEDSLWQQQLGDVARTKQHYCDLLQKKDATKAELDQARAANIDALNWAGRREISSPTQRARITFMGYQVSRVQNSRCAVGR